jgi:hypothetical protein
VLRVNRQMRQEALPFAYRRTDFHLDDLDRAIKFLVAVGETGRENIEFLHFAWESPSDPACRWETHPISEANLLDSAYPSHFKVCPTAEAVQKVAALTPSFRRRITPVYNAPNFHGRSRHPKSLFASRGSEV